MNIPIILLLCSLPMRSIDEPMQDIRYSVVIPALNEEQFLPLLLQDLANQTERAFEVIVADGGSTDATASKTHMFDAVLPHLTFLQSKKGNVAHQRNLAAKQAQGTYIIFLDADSRIPRDFMYQARQVVHAHPTGLYLTYFHPDSDAITLRVSYWIMNRFVCLARYFPRSLSSVGSVMVARRVFEEVGGYDESIYIGEDHNLVNRVKASQHKVFCSKKLRVTFSLRRIRREGMLRSLYILFFGIGYALLKGDIRKKYFAYDMGGSQYTTTSDSLTQPHTKKKK